ncbi:S8 family serine peptidase [Cyanothece sp. BG0011]|uniref:S8 family serine peptidase n=1 Tax=Cyanothece sp. BG0011 TaxID=2082950 RepID=UPI000D1DBCEA|nr:S8 family serine peptidase [Cyanothece sp. BG0011]
MKFLKRIGIIALFFLGVSWAVCNFQGLANKGEFDSIVLNFKQDIPITEVENKISQLSQQYNQEIHLNSEFSNNERVYILEGNKQFLKQLKESGLSELTDYIEPNYQYHTLEAVNDPQYSEQWNLQNINIEAAWRKAKGKGVTVAVIDTGVSRVPDLQKTEFVEGYDFVNDKKEANDDHGHGTHVAGTVAQSTNNRYGVAGVAYQAKIMPLKVLSAAGFGTISDIAEAIRFAADHNADIINMSLGGGGASQMMEDAINYAHEKGVVIVAAAGNEGRSSASYPSRYDKVISVSALNANNEKAFYSNYGVGVDISAPGGGQDKKILQETIDPNTGQAILTGFMGTSMASPHVAGVAALIRSAGVKEPDKIRQILEGSAKDIENDKLNYYGSGQLDAEAALKLAKKGQFPLGLDHDLLMKLLMLAVAYGFTVWFSQSIRFTDLFHLGMVLGSCGFFLLKLVEIFDVPQWPLRLVSSPLGEWGNAIQGSVDINPIFASVLIPFCLMALLLGNSIAKWFAMGITLGMAGFLTVTTFTSPGLWLFSSDLLSQIFLGVNALLCLGLVSLSLKES